MSTSSSPVDVASRGLFDRDAPKPFQQPIPPGPDGRSYRGTAAQERQDIVEQPHAVTDGYRINARLQGDELAYGGFSKNNWADANSLSPKPQIKSQNANTRSDAVPHALRARWPQDRTTLPRLTANWTFKNTGKSRLMHSN
jgi:hypothetical protein